MTPDQIIATGIAVFIAAAGLAALALALLPVIDMILDYLRGRRK